MSQVPKERLIDHNKGRSKFTSGHIPWVLFYTEECENSLDARTKEKYYKGTGRPFVKQKLAEFLKP
jgi:predicted GIY-YIG superfamily endonuclease